MREVKKMALFGFGRRKTKKKTFPLALVKVIVQLLKRQKRTQTR